MFGKILCWIADRHPRLRHLHDWKSGEISYYALDVSRLPTYSGVPERELWFAVKRCGRKGCKAFEKLPPQYLLSYFPALRKPPYGISGIRIV